MCCRRGGPSLLFLSLCNATVMMMRVCIRLLSYRGLPVVGRDQCGGKEQKNGTATSIFSVMRDGAAGLA